LDGQAYSLLFPSSSNSTNNKSIVFATSSAGYQGLTLLFAARNTSTGFSEQWAWSTDGNSFTNVGGLITPPNGSFAQQTLLLPSDVNDAASLYLRVTFSGASGTNQNNRLDNVVIRSSNFTWFGTTNSYTAASNWTASGLASPYNTAPGSGANINFQGTATAPSLSSPTTVGAITYLSGTSGFIFGGSSPLTINGGVDNRSAISQRISVPIVLGAAQTWNARSGAFRALSTVALGSAANNYNLTIDGAGDVDMDGDVSNGGSGSSGIIKNGAGKLTLSGNNTFTGGLTVNNGVVLLAHDGALNSTTPNAVTFTGGTLRLNGHSVSVSGLSGASGSVENAAGTAAVFNIDLGSVDGSFGGTIQNGAGGGALSLRKQGTKTLTLTAANSYSGFTEVLGGTLRLNGTHTGGGAYTIGDGVNAATFSGNGTTDAPVTVKAAAFISPGNSIDTLHTGSLTIDGGSLVAEVNFNNSLSLQPTADQVDVSGDVTINSGSSLQLELLDVPSGTLSQPRTVVLVKNNGPNPVGGAGQFANFPEGAGVFQTLVNYIIDYHYDSTSGTPGAGNDIAITFTTVPEPGSATILLGLSGCLVGRRFRRATA
jgi:autotransporter-associated beta strand protein